MSKWIVAGVVVLALAALLLLFPRTGQTPVEPAPAPTRGTLSPATTTPTARPPAIPSSLGPDSIHFPTAELIAGGQRQEGLRGTYFVSLYLPDNRSTQPHGDTFGLPVPGEPLTVTGPLTVALEFSPDITVTAAALEVYAWDEWRAERRATSSFLIRTPPQGVGPVDGAVLPPATRATYRLDVPAGHYYLYLKLSWERGRSGEVRLEKGEADYGFNVCVEVCLAPPADSLWTAVVPGGAVGLPSPLDRAHRLDGVPILVPTRLPQGFQFSGTGGMDRDGLVTHDFELIYIRPSNGRITSRFSIDEAPALRPEPTVDPTVHAETVSIDGLPARLVSGLIPPYPMPATSGQSVSRLQWTEAGVFMLISGNLSREEIIKVAESMTVLPPPRPLPPTAVSRAVQPSPTPTPSVVPAPSTPFSTTTSAKG